VKDQATLLRGVALLGEGVTLDIAGTGPEEGRLRGLVEELGIAARVRFLGAVSHQAMPEFYRGAALNLLTSRHEGLGMVTLEAAACGVPTISTAVGLLPDVPEIGLTVPVGDDIALARVIQELLDDDERRAALAKLAYQTVRERFTIQHTVKQFQDLYGVITRDSTNT
jgi:glycosyltransferase involved in cell wall biosynthesis